MTCLPLPLPSEAPSMIPGRSRTWISAPPYSSTPGIAVNVVNEYAATSLFVFVIFDRNVDLPTDGNPTSAMRASPLLLTSKPAPPPDPAPGAGSRSCARRRASFLAGVDFREETGNEDLWTSGLNPPFQKPQVVFFEFVSTDKTLCRTHRIPPVALFSTKLHQRRKQPI